ncbi:uncharacterized protein LOC144790912 [Lissotriton helveticus]
MISIQDLKKMKPEDNKPYQKTIRANVIKCSTKTNYTNAKQENKVMYHLALADESSCIKATCYNEPFYQQTKEGQAIMIRNFLAKNNVIIITKQTKLSRMIPLTIPQEIIQEAEYILQPPAPPISPIKTVKTASLRSLMSISGTIAEEEETKTIIIAGQDTKLKSITVKDTTDSVKITLWRDATDFPIEIGSYIKMTHLTVHEFSSNKMLNTTRNTQFQKIQPPEEEINMTIYGLETAHQEHCTLNVHIDNAENLQSVEINNNVLLDFFNIPADIDDIQEALMPSWPKNVNVIFQNGYILKIHELCSRDYMMLIIETAREVLSILAKEIEELEEKLKKDNSVYLGKKKLEEISLEIDSFAEYLLKRKMEKFRKDV